MFTGATHSKRDRNLLLFCLSGLVLLLLFLLPLFPHPPRPAGGEFSLHFFENVTTIKATMVLMITVVKGRSI